MIHFIAFVSREKLLFKVCAARPLLFISSILIARVWSEPERRHAIHALGISILGSFPRLNWNFREMLEKEEGNKGEIQSATARVTHVTGKFCLGN